MEEKVVWQLTLRLFSDEKAFGPGIATLLRKIETLGSLQKAAQSMGMAYSKAWKTLREIEKVWGFPLTYRDVGGKNGGGSSLTPGARFLLEHYENFTEELRKSADNIFEKYYSGSFYSELEKIQSREAGEED